MLTRALLIPAVFLFLVSAACAQDWSSVGSLKSGRRIYLNDKSGNELKGRVVAVSDSAIDLRVDGRHISIARGDVLTIHSAARGSILKRTLVGAAAGAGIGSGVGAAVVAATRSDGLAAAGGFLYGIPIGAVVGAATTGHKKGKLIYSSN